MQSLSKIWAISTPLHQLARCLIRYENTYAPENSFWSIIKLGNIGKDFGNLGVGENWVKKVFDGNVAVYIGQKAVMGDFLGQF